MPSKKKTVAVKVASSESVVKVKVSKGKISVGKPAKVPKTLIDKIYASIRACGKKANRNAIKKHMHDTYKESNIENINKALVKASKPISFTLKKEGETFTINETILSGKGWRVEVYNELMNSSKFPTVFFFETEKEAKSFQRRANEYLVHNKSDFDEVHPSNGGCVWITGLVSLDAPPENTVSKCTPLRCTSNDAFAKFAIALMQWDKELKNM